MHLLYRGGIAKLNDQPRIASLSLIEDLLTPCQDESFSLLKLSLSTQSLLQILELNKSASLRPSPVVLLVNSLIGLSYFPYNVTAMTEASLSPAETFVWT